MTERVEAQIIASRRTERLRQLEDQLDEYERSVLDTWRKRAMKVFALLTSIGGFIFMLLGSRLDTPGSTALLAAGYFMLFTFLIAYPLPMIGYAITFNRKED